ncbi:helix-turn-helix transcriptional regulator [Actinacidiphila rubida]|uniref:Helix-turn-helix domain-containing protein n=1 Tax=Actinacidiphila rubida TaxID=310780 RepID=A0A1H8NLJ5_9ACTN|nr:helix-turn-helix transcriptional regulator [Actinacidiphila rubida]SEO30278.1 Helix-turn-helix domain-containing protein [Actinacidiphila rubida]
MDHPSGNRGEIRDFLAGRRARITPAQAGLPTSARRRVAGLRREEVAVLAGVSTEWYTRLEKGHIGGVSEGVLDAVARALRLDDDERTYLFDLARSSRHASRTPSRRGDVEVPPRVRWLLDSMTTSSAFVRNGRTDIVAGNPLARALLAPIFDSATGDGHGHPNIARYVFLEPGAHDFFVDWDAAAVATAALLRAEMGREPRDRALRELVGELSTLSPEFRRQWAVHDVLMRHDGVKRLQHPDVGHLELTFQTLDLPLSGRAVHDLVIYTAEPGTASEDRLELLTTRAATRARAAQRTRHCPQPGEAFRRPETA